MKPDKFSVYELFERNRRYVVPLFQRPYVWDEENQWFPLWEDITNKANELIERENRSDVVGSHFLGAAVINELPTYGREVPAYEIIDGQQRLTTLQIILNAFQNFLRDMDYKDFDRDLERLTENISRKDEAEQYKVWPTTADQKIFEIVMSYDSLDHLKSYLQENDLENARLAQAYLFFYEMIGEYVRYGEIDDEIDSPPFEYDSDMGLSRIEVLMEAIRRYLEIVVIELEDDDDPQIIFETLNARGVPLLPSDLIRNFVFLEASRNNDPTEELYKKYWYNYDNPVQGEADFWKEEEKQGRLTRPRIDLFFFYYVTMKTIRDYKISYLFHEFKRWWQQQVDDTGSVEPHLQELNKYSDIYRDLITSDKNTRLGVFIDRLETIGIGTVYPILFYLKGECTYLSQSEFDDIISDLESYLIRRMICRLTGSSYNRIFLSVLRDLKMADKVTRQIFQETLLSSEGDTARWPDDKEFRNCWMNTPVYRRLAKMRTRMVLEAIDLQLETNRQEMVHITETLTIEHIFPQNPEYGAWPELTDEEKDMTHTFGNLTLLTTALNSSVSNGQFSKKRYAIARQSKLRLNAQFQDLADQEEWTLDDIQNRGAELFDVAVDIWSRPDVQPTTQLSPGKKRSVDSLIEVASENGVGESFQLLLNAGIDNFLYLSVNKNSIMFAPRANKTRCLYTIWTNPTQRFLRVYVATSAFSEFFSISPDEAENILGEDGWRAMSNRDAQQFVEAINMVLQNN